MEIKKMEVELESICPYLQDRWINDSNAKTEPDYKREAEAKVYRDDKGKAGIPGTQLKACIREASSELGKKMEGRKNRQMIRAGVFIQPVIIPLGKDYDELKRDIVTRKGTGDKVTRVSTYRPMFNDWRAKFSISLIGVTPEFVAQALELGGMKYGIGGFRPEFGRFIVKSWRLAK